MRVIHFVGLAVASTSAVTARGRSSAAGAVSVPVPLSMGLVDAVPDKLKNVFASKPKPASRR